MKNHKKKPTDTIHQALVKPISVLAVILLLALSGCQQSSDDDGSSDRTTPTTTATPSASGGCILSGTTYNCTGSTSITFSVSESATVYYAQQIGSSPTVSTSSDSSSAPFSISVTGSEKDTVYIKYFAVDSSNNTESSKQIIIYLIDSTEPISSIESVKLTVDSSTDCNLDSSSNTYSCQGPAYLKITANESSTIYYTSSIGSAPSDPDITSNSINSGETLNITENDTYVKFFARDYALTPNSESTIHDCSFEINGISAGIVGETINKAYYNQNKGIILSKSSNRTIPGSNYQIYYRMISGPDVSADTSSDHVFNGSPPIPDSDSIRYYDTYPYDPIEDPTAITLSTSDNTTTIYQIKYNLIYGGSQGFSSPDISDGSADNEGSIVVIIDKDEPNLLTLPPSSGNLETSISIMPFIQDSGLDKMNVYKASNPTLSDTTADETATAMYCKREINSAYSNGYDFWSECTETNYTSVSSSTVLQNITTNTYLAFTGIDKATNSPVCNETYQFSCEDPDYGFHNSYGHIVEYFTPGIQQSGIYHDFELPTSEKHTNFGHSIAVGDLDGDNRNDDIIIGAPAYSYSFTPATSEANGAIYIWYDGFRERALKQFYLGDSSTDISGNKWLEFSTDSGNTLRINLDPSNDTSGLARSTDYTDKTKAKAAEIASYLNRAFLNSYSLGSNGTFLYALPTDSNGNIVDSDSTADGYITIGHINRTIEGYFTYQSSNNFDVSSDLNYGNGSTKTIRAYDYAVFGENNGDEFGFSVGISSVDIASDSLYSSKNIVVGAPGYSTDNGALYVLQAPISDTSADYSQIKLESGIYSYAYRIDATTDGRLGTSLAFYDRNGDGTNDIYVSAPYYGNTYRGAVYEIRKDFPFDNSSDTTTDIGDGSTVTDSIVGSTDNMLFGFSMVIGKTKMMHSSASTTHLYVGSPGREGADDVLGEVSVYGVVSGTSFQDTTVRKSEPLGVGIEGNLFGYSLAIVDSGFDSDSPSACPCLVVGSPGSQSNAGRVYIYGGDYSSHIDGSSDITNDKLGVSLAAGDIGELETFDTIFIGTRNDHKGRVVVIRQQNLTSGTDLTEYDSLSITLEGSKQGDNLGSSLGLIVLSNGKKALITGFAGEHNESITSSSYYRMGNVYNRKGAVHVYSAGRLGF